MNHRIPSVDAIGAADQIGGQRGNQTHLGDVATRFRGVSFHGPKVMMELPRAEIQFKMG